MHFISMALRDDKSPPGYPPVSELGAGLLSIRAFESHRWTARTTYGR